MATRILQIIPTLDRGGAERQLTLLAANLPREEFDVHVCLLTRSGPLVAELEAARVPVETIGKSWKLDPLAWWNLRGHIASLAPRIVQTWLFAANCYGRSAAWAARVPIIVGGERCVDLWKAGYELAIDRTLAGVSRRIVVNSSGVQEFYEHQGIPSDKFVVIPNGASPPPAPPADRELARAELRTELGLPPNARIIGLVGRLWPQKRHKDAIWAMDLIQCCRDDVHLLLIGDGPERWRLERYAEQVTVAGRVHFLGELGDVPRLLPLLDCLWLTSEYEGLPNAILEAQLAGTPVIATEIPGNTDLVEHDVTGLLIPLGDRAELAKKTMFLLDEPAVAARLAAAARERAMREFSVPRMVERYVTLYRQLLAEQ